MAYTAPTWNNDAPPAITAEAMQEISDNLEYVSNNICNRNLLHNWYFGNPVNQRGKAVYSGVGFTVDRWQARSAQCYATVGDGVLKLEESGTGVRVYYQQKLEWPVTEVATLSVLTGTVFGSCSAYIMTADGTDPGIGMTLKANTLNVMKVSTKDIGAVGFGVPDAGRIDLKAVKLEIGGVSTLAHQDEGGNWILNEIPDFAEQSNICKRYLQVMQSASETTNNPIAMGFANAATDLWVTFQLPVAMRAVPTVSVNDYALLKVGKTAAASVDVTRAIGGWSMTDNKSTVIRSLVFITTGMTAGETYNLYALNGAQIMLSAEL